MQDQADREANAEKQLYGNTAEDIWLDSWLSDNFGVPRNIGETDLAYFTRAKYEIFSLKVNNKALMKLIADAVSYFVDVKDLGAIPGCYFYTNRPNSITNNSNSADSLLFNTTLGNVKDGVFGVYIYNGSINNFSALDKKAITGIVQRYKAEGTRAIYFAPAQRLITNHLGANLNNIEYVIGPRYTGWAEVIV